MKEQAGDGRGSGLEEINRELQELSRLREEGALDADGYRQACYQLLSGIDDDGRGQQGPAAPATTRPGRRSGVSLWFWLLPVLLALIFLGGLAGMLAWLLE